MKDSEKNNGTYRNNGKFWLALDNAAKIFPAVISDELTVVFRISAVMMAPIHIRSLLKAMDQLAGRFPYFNMTLEKGFFWYYLEYTDQKVSPQVDMKPPCRKMPDGKPLYRILVVRNRLSVEFSHILTDGSGAFEYLKSLLIEYLSERGVNIPDGFSYCHPDEPIPEEEFEDAYNRYFKEEIPPMVKQSGAFHLPFPVKEIPRFSVVNARASVSEVKKKAAEKGVDITVYLTSVYLYALQDVFRNTVLRHRRRTDKRLRIQVPINLRNIYPSRTMRNFSLYVMPEIDLRLGHYTFDEIIKTVYHQMQLETDEKLINKILARNVGSEKKLMVRGIPLFLKSFILRLKYYSLGTKQYSGVISNLGKAEFPAVIARNIDHFIVTLPPPNKKLKVNCGIIGYQDKLVLSFGNITNSKELEKGILKFMMDQGLKFKVSTYESTGL